MTPYCTGISDVFPILVFPGQNNYLSMFTSDISIPSPSRHQIYEYYQRPEAWTVTPGAVSALQRLRKHGVLLAVVSNFDTRLRPLLDNLNLTHLFDEIVVSAEVGRGKGFKGGRQRQHELALNVAGCPAVYVFNFRRMARGCSISRPLSIYVAHAGRCGEAVSSHL